jgi:glycosyltransferase involved in cell wall biosynthesis
VRCTKENLAERLGAVLADDASRRALGERGRAYVEREHAAPVLAARLIELYRSITIAPESAHA